MKIHSYYQHLIISAFIKFTVQNIRFPVETRLNYQRLVFSLKFAIRQIRFIVETQGFPSQHMLQRGEKSSRFFTSNPQTDPTSVTLQDNYTGYRYSFTNNFFSVNNCLLGTGVNKFYFLFALITLY